MKLVSTLFLAATLAPQALASPVICALDCSNMATCDHLDRNLNLGSVGCKAIEAISFDKLKYCGESTDLTNVTDYRYDITIAPYVNPTPAPNVDNTVTKSVVFPVLEACGFIKLETQFIGAGGYSTFKKLEMLSFPSLKYADGVRLDCNSDETDSYCPKMTSASFPNLVTVGSNDVEVYDLYPTSPFTISFPKLRFNSDYLGVGNLNSNVMVSFPQLLFTYTLEYENANMDTIELPELTTVGKIFIYDDKMLKSVSFPKLVSYNEAFDIYENVQLKTISAPLVLPVQSNMDDSIYQNPMLETIDIGTRSSTTAALNRKDAAQAELAEETRSTANDTLALGAFATVCLIVIIVLQILQILGVFEGKCGKKKKVSPAKEEEARLGPMQAVHP